MTTNWTEYAGDIEGHMQTCMNSNGFLLRFEDGTESDIIKPYPQMFNKKITHYWIIPDDPLRDMKIRQAQTGQPVWIKSPSNNFKVNSREVIAIGNTYCTTTPDWNIPNAEYSFTPFEDKS